MGSIEAEKTAKDQRLGFWNNSTFVTPKDWRRGIRPVASKPTTIVSNPVSNNGSWFVEIELE